MNKRILAYAVITLSVVYFYSSEVQASSKDLSGRFLLCADKNKKPFGIGFDKSKATKYHNFSYIVERRKDFQLYSENLGEYHFREGWIVISSEQDIAQNNDIRNYLRPNWVEKYKAKINRTTLEYHQPFFSSEQIFNCSLSTKKLIEIVLKHEFLEMKKAKAKAESQYKL